MGIRRKAAVGAGVAAGGAGLVRARRTSRHPAFPPGPDAIRAEDAKAATKRLLDQDRVARRDLALDLAAAEATSVDPLLHGRRYFPRMLDDIAAATDSIHLLIYGYKPGEIGTTFRDALAAKVRAGVEVRLQVDAIGSEIDFGSRGLFRDLRECGISIVANDGILPDRDGLLGARRFDWRLDDFGHFDHRKMMVVDGRVAYVGGSGIEDHYNDERFYDVDVPGHRSRRRPAPARSSSRAGATRAGRSPSRSLEPYFPADVLDVPADAAAGRADDDPAERPRGGPPPDQRRDRAVDRGGEAGHPHRQPVHRRPGDPGPGSSPPPSAGVETRIVAPGKPTPPYPAAAFRHHYERLLDAGATILLHPQMAHAKVLRIDDRVFIGGCNLDDLSLFRNDELDLLFDSPAVAELTERQVFDELVAMSTPATIPGGRREKAWNATMDRISRFL